MGVLNTWHNLAKDVRLTKQKKEERAQAVLNKYAMEGNMMLQLIVQTWGSDTKMEVMARELKAKQDEEMRAQQVGQKEERARAALARMSGDINRFVGICLQGWGALCGEKARKRERTKAVLARIVAEGEKLFGMCYREWSKYSIEITRRKKAREERVKALMGRLAMQSQSTMVM